MSAVVLRERADRIRRAIDRVRFRPARETDRKEEAVAVAVRLDDARAAVLAIEEAAELEDASAAYGGVERRRGLRSVGGGGRA